MSNKILKEDIIELTKKRKEQMDQQELAPEDVRNFLLEFSEIIIEIEREAARGFVDVYPYKDDFLYGAKILLLGEGIEVWYDAVLEVIEVFTISEGKRELLDIIRKEEGGFFTSYSRNKVTPSDILDYFKSTNIFHHLKLIIEQ